MSIEIGDGGLGYIYLGDVLIAGGGGESGWKPSANTLAYYPLNGNANDYSINQTKYNGTWNGTASYTAVITGSSIQCANFQYNSSTVNYIYSTLQTAPKTVSFWLKFDDTTTTSSGQDWRQIIGQVGSEAGVWQLRANVSPNVWIINGNNKNTTLDKSWHNICLTLDNGTITLYKDGVQEAQQTSTTITSSGNLYIGGNTYGYNGTYKRALYGKMSEVILESVVRTTTEISNYYNQTKSKYGL